MTDGWVALDDVSLTGSTVTKYYTLGGQRVAQRQGSVLTYLHGDHLGSASLATDASGAKITDSDTRYYPYGVTRPGLAGTGLPTDRRFTGQREEASLGFYDYGARPYAPALGRFLQADTLVPQPGNPQSLNRYAYTLNNPLRYTDPTGHRVLPEDIPGVKTHPVTGEWTTDVTTVEGWTYQALANLSDAGPVCQHAANYIINNNVTIFFGWRPWGGAFWTSAGRVGLNSRYYSTNSSPEEIGTLALIVHETKHLEQGFDLALSVEGELQAWQIEIEANRELGVDIERFSLEKRNLYFELPWEPLRPTDAELHQAADLMFKDQHGHYPIYLLPLRPERWSEIDESLYRYVYWNIRLLNSPRGR